MNVSESKYVGASACFHCHQAEYQVWQATKHASSFDSLLGNEKQKYYCLQCHTTDGAQHLAGFKIKNVECEACHGMGEAHVKAHTLQDKTLIAESKMTIPNREKLCLRCHGDKQSMSLEAFDYTKMWGKIIHGKNQKKS